MIGGETMQYKARLVAKGIDQVFGVDYVEIFSTVVCKSNYSTCFSS